MIRPQKETRQSARLTTLRMSVAQAEDSLREGLKQRSLRLCTVLYYYCFTKYDYAVKAFAFATASRYSNKFSLWIRLSAEQIKAKTSFRLRAPYG
jgi:hypothetical protein